MSATLVVKTAKDGQSTPQPFNAALLDLLGDGSKLAFVHALVGAGGALITPASGADIQALITALGLAPAQTSDVAAATAKVEAVRALLAAVLNVQGTVTANLGTLNGVALDASVAALGTKLDTLHTDVGGNHTDLGAILTRLGATLAVSATTLPLPAGAATAAKQDILDADLKAIQPRSIASNAPAVDATGTLSASGDTVSVAAGGMSTLVVRLPTGAWSGSVVVEGTADGTNYDVPLNVIPYGGGASQSALTAGGVYEVTVTGLAGARVRATSAIAGGPVTALVRAANGLKSLRVGAPAGNPVPTSSPTPAVVVTGQIKVAVTGTAVQLPANPLVNGLVIKARATNAGNGFVGPAGVTTTYDGTGNGYPVEPGAAASFATSNSNAVYVNGTAGDVFSFEGN